LEEEFKLSSSPFNLPLDAWLQAAPLLAGFPEADAKLLARYVQVGEDFLALLPAKSKRSSEHAEQATKIHEACRNLRRQFMALHTDWLYNSLTKGQEAHKCVHDLAFGAAELCPGLVPTAAQIGLERTHPQTEKEGYEIDQGLLFYFLLRSPKISVHLIQSMLLPTIRSKQLLTQFSIDGSLDLGTVFIRRIGCAAHITLNNCYCLNAEDDRLVDDIETAVDLALLDEKTRVGVMRGGVMKHPRYAGRRVFSAGINLKALHAGQISFVDFFLRRELGFINKVVRGLRSENGDEGRPSTYRDIQLLDKPWIGVVDSFAIGGGAQLLLIFDRVIAGSDSYFNLPAAKEGIIPGFANLRLQRFLGSRGARQVILDGRKIWATEPDARLLIDDVVKSSELDIALKRSIEQLSKPAVSANRHMLALAEEPLQLFIQYAAEFCLMQAERLYSPDVYPLSRTYGC
jgi:(3,5-dihydroxyphenyl)acetyl-CoA 1,2-dioxygenase